MNIENYNLICLIQMRKWEQSQYFLFEFTFFLTINIDFINSMIEPPKNPKKAPYLK